MSGPIHFKMLEFDAVQIRSLIGKAGETIKDVRNRCGNDVDVNIQSIKGNDYGVVRLTGDVAKAEKIIGEVLAVKGCLLNRHMLNLQR